MTPWLVAAACGGIGVGLSIGYVLGILAEQRYRAELEHRRRVEAQQRHPTRLRAVPSREGESI